ncbi:hypothetical protein [Lyngbya aestuarii]|uniref:hypothetical protein n=1 Tax=Lyngbya aestuarii TaxID=118322 RepID=UPI00403DC96F
MVKPSCQIDSPTYQKGYQQALEDFAICHLIIRLKTYSDANFDAAWMNLTPPELESLATIFIQDLTANLKGKVIAGYLNTMRHGSTDIPPSLVHRTFSPPPSIDIDLPANFPEVQTPRYLYGDKLRWIPESNKTDWGVAIGRFYSFAPHRCAWTWCYLIWLDKLSPSSSWTVADTAWENDLEPLEDTP